MAQITRIDGLFRDEVGENLFRRLITIYPDGQVGSQGHVFRAVLRGPDKRVAALIEALTDAGYSPWTDRTRPKDRARKFTLEMVREYDESDLAPCRYLELCPRAECHGEYRDEATGRIKLDIHRLDNSADFALARNERYVVPGRVKQRLEAAALSHVIFRPTLLTDPTSPVHGEAPVIPWAEWGPPWWEITSDRSLPPVSPTMELHDFFGRPAAHGDRDKSYVPREGFHVHPELHYREIDLVKLPDFDLARTFESFGGELRWDERTLVASHRFYRFCRDAGLDTRWVPVRIDPE